MYPTFILRWIKNVETFIFEALNNWYERQIEIFINAEYLLNQKDNVSVSEKLSSVIWKTNSISNLHDKICLDVNACKDHLYMIFTMFEEMGLNKQSSMECLRLLIQTENIPKSYIRTLCLLWYKYRMYTMMQDDLFNAPLLIQQNKNSIYNLFRFQLKPLLGINEEQDIILKEYCKHQADISKTLELVYLTETSKLFHGEENKTECNPEVKQLLQNEPQESEYLTMGIKSVDHAHFSAETVIDKYSNQLITTPSQ